MTSFADAAAAELRTAVVREHNAFKIPLAQRAIVRGLSEAMAAAAPGGLR
jgi:xanthine dehydrogenase YagS FAD-binding subunit